MSSIRLYILAALADEGEMHGHQLKQLAEKEHVQLWTDFSVGALYGALKRLAGEGLITEVRTERAGSYPERQVWGITDQGRISLTNLRMEGLSEIVIRPDPVDLALTRPDRDRLDSMPALLEARLASLRAMLAHKETHTEAISQYLTELELFVMSHGAERIRTEIAWHEKLLARLPGFIEQERHREDLQK